MGEFHRPCGQVIRRCQDGVKFQPLGMERKQQILGGGDVLGTLADILRPKAQAGIGQGVLVAVQLVGASLVAAKSSHTVE